MFLFFTISPLAFTNGKASHACILKSKSSRYQLDWCFSACESKLSPVQPSVAKPYMKQDSGNDNTGEGVSFSGDIQDPPGRGPVQPAVGDPASAGGLD